MVLRIIVSGASLRRATEHRQGDQQVVPDPEELEDAEGRQRGGDERQQHLEEDPTWPAPSTRAASSSEAGISFMKLCSRNTASGSALALCDNQSDQYDPPRPRSWNIVTKGRRAIWSGTICSANTATNNALRNGKSIHAKAYAASDARRRGRSTAGMTMTKC